MHLFIAIAIVLFVSVILHLDDYYAAIREYNEALKYLKFFGNAQTIPADLLDLLTPLNKARKYANRILLMTICGYIFLLMGVMAWP